MSNILNTNPSNQPIVVETENTISLLTNIYRKDDLSCVTKTGLSFNNVSVGNNYLNITKYMNIGTSYCLGERDKRFGIVPDPYILNRFYYVLNNSHSNINNKCFYLVFAEEDNDNINILGNIKIDNVEFREIMDIDEKYIYVSGVHLNNGGIFIYRINKETKSITSTIFQVTATNRAKANLIYKDETYLYFITGGVSNAQAYGRFYFTRYNKITAETLNTLYTPPNLTIGTKSYNWNNNNIWMACNNIDIENFYKENDKYYWCYPQRSGSKLTTGEGNANNNLMIMCYDSSKSFNESGVITFRTTIGLQDIEELKWKSGDFSYRFWIIDDYLYYAIYDETNSDADMRNIQGIHVFKINPGFILDYITKIQISKDRSIISMVYSSDKNTLLIGYYNSFEIYILNKNTHIYEKLNKQINNVMCAGFDSLDRLWYQNTNYGVFVENLDDPQQVNIAFEKIYYTYEGEDIESYITFEALSFTDKIPIGKYILTLTGNAYFKDTSSNTLTINYTGGVLKFNIIITGPKRLTCSTKYQKVW